MREIITVMRFFTIYLPVPVEQVTIPSLTLYKAKNSHNPNVYQGRGCFCFCIDMYYF